MLRRTSPGMGVLAVAVALGLTGCGKQDAATRSAMMTRVEAGRAYLAAVAPANTVLVAFKAKASNWKHSTRPKQAAADAGPLIFAITALRTKLLALASGYPPAADDLNHLVTANEGLQGDLVKLRSLSKLNAGVWILQFAADAGASHAAVASVRFDLGLPLPRDATPPSSRYGSA